MRIIIVQIILAKFSHCSPGVSILVLRYFLAGPSANQRPFLTRTDNLSPISIHRIFRYLDPSFRVLQPENPFNFVDLQVLSADSQTAAEVFAKDPAARLPLIEICHLSRL